MKAFLLLVIGTCGLALSGVRAADAPRGNLLELHSCEVYAGPCIINSQAPQGGRYMLRAWDFAGGEFDGANLSGLDLGVLQLSTDNLAADDSVSGKAVVYLPNAATEAQRNALLAWLKSQPDFRPSNIQIRTVPMEFSQTGNGYTFSAGNFIRVKSAPLNRCQTGGCGEVLWYQPRSQTSVFTVASDDGSRVSEPMLRLKWNDADQRSVFLARFGDAIPAKNLYVSLPELCGTKGSLF